MPDHETGGAGPYRVFPQLRWTDLALLTASRNSPRMREPAGSGTFPSCRGVTECPGPAPTPVPSFPAAHATKTRIEKNTRKVKHLFCLRVIMFHHIGRDFSVRPFVDCRRAGGPDAR